MSSSPDIWKMLAGIAFFLLAMNFMEDSLRLLAGRRFKIFLKHQTNNRLKAIGGGAIVTGLLQSSSIVNLLILSMVGAGVVKMENALAIILGSNLGSTFSSWLIATIGFSYQIENLAMPAAGIAGVVMAFAKKESKLFLWFKFLFSLAFLFIAFGFIKSGMEEWVKQTDLSAFTKYPLTIYLLLGILLTAVVQSSSVTMALTLSALHTNAISFSVAMAIVSGSEIGTTLKLFLAASNGIAVKKRVALGNFLFNTVTVIILFILLKPVTGFIINILSIKHQLFAIVFFQTFLNLCCIILFLPFLKPLSRFLAGRFTKSQDESFFISKVSVEDTALALEALENETKHFITHIINYSLRSFHLKEPVVAEIQDHKNFTGKTITEQYGYIKQLHGEMHGFYLKLQNITADKIETERLEQLIATIRNCMYAAKNINDAQSDIEQTANSSNELKYAFYTQSRQKLFLFYESLLSILDRKINQDTLQQLTSLYHSITTGYTQSLQSLYKESMANGVSEIEISTLINFNRELYTSFKSVLFGVKDYLLSPKEAAYFDELPGFIR
jgi:phosphate:Na+ symporter